MNTITNHKGELLFRVCAYALTGIQCTAYVLTFSLLFFFLYGLLPEGTVYSTKTGYTFYGITHTILFIIILPLPNLLGWFLSFLYPLRSKSQTWGMKMFGLKAVNSKEIKLSWKTAFLQEGVQTITCGFFVGLFGLVLALFNDNEKTFFNRISGISIIQDQASFKFVEEFREYRKNKA